MKDTDRQQQVFKILDELKTAKQKLQASTAAAREQRKIDDKTTRDERIMLVATQHIEEILKQCDRQSKLGENSLSFSYTEIEESDFADVQFLLVALLKDAGLDVESDLCEYPCNSLTVRW